MFTGYLLLTNYVDSHINTSYKGIFRAGLFRNMPISEEDKDEFELWLKSADKADENGFFPDLDIVREVGSQYNKLGKKFDIVKCIDVSEKDESENIIITKQKFLGYDICDTSLQSLIFIYGYDRYSNNNKMDTNNILRILSLNYYYEKLNENRLFINYQSAKLFIETEKLIIQIQPNINHLHLRDNFKIYKVYKIE